MSFPKNFIWGTATAAYQIEGASNEDSRGESIWDRYSHTPGYVLNGDTGDVACDHYHRFEEDIQLIKELGVDAYRYSIAWPRIMPNGSGPVNQKGIDFYRRLTEKLLENGIRPFVTMFHWDLPQTLEDAGGWTSRETALRFGDYAETIVRSLGDLVKDWMTLNEPWCSSILGYQLGSHAPGRQENPQVITEVIHNHLLAHGLGVRAVRAHGAPDSQVGIVLNTCTYLPATDSPEDVQAVNDAYTLENGWWLDPLYKGVYPSGTWRNLEGARPTIHDGDMEIISSPTDFLGLNIYFGAPTSADPNWEFDDSGYEHTEMGWIVVPQAIYEAIRQAAVRYPVGKIYITENGAAYPDVIAEDGHVHDADRISYLKRYIAQVERAADEGIPVKGYFLWSLMDNFEWSFGYTKRFGIVYVDYANGLARIPKDSYYFYKELVSKCR